MAKIINAIIPVLKANYHRMTSPYGMRTNPFDKNDPVKKMHWGIDLTGKSGAVDDITAFEDGVVIYARDTVEGKNKDYPAGNYVVLKHTNGYTTRYLHLAYGTVKVKKGDSVRRGQVIGRMGTTGSSTGNHLHFDVLLNNARIDPVPYLLGLSRIVNDPLVGDVDFDGDVDAVDYMYVKRLLLGNIKLTDEQK